jgi:small subunit ribosomal protein S9
LSFALLPLQSKVGHGSGISVGCIFLSLIFMPDNFNKDIKNPSQSFPDQAEPTFNDDQSKTIQQTDGKLESKTNENQIYTALGRRKSSTARVWLRSGQGIRTINQRPCEAYLNKNLHLIFKFEQPLRVAESKLKFERTKFDLDIQVHGGGLTGQVAAIHLALSRVLSSYNEAFRPFFKQKGFLKRDARIKERKKYGLKKARKAGQYSKR